MLALTGAILSGLAAYHLATGISFMQATSKATGGEHVASASELWFGTVGGIPILLFGVLVLLSTFNTAVTIDDVGISSTNLLKRVTFKAAWPEVTLVEKVNTRQGAGSYVVVANGKKLNVNTSIANMHDLVAEIKKRSGEG